MSLSNDTVAKTLNLHQDEHFKETTLSPLRTDGNVESPEVTTVTVKNPLRLGNDDNGNDSNHNPQLDLEQRLKLPDNPPSSGIVNGAGEKKSVFCDPVNGFVHDLGGFGDENKCDGDGEKKAKVPQTVLSQVSQPDSASIRSSLNTLSAGDTTECDGANQNQTTTTNLPNDNIICVEKLTEDLTHAALIENSTSEEGDVVNGISYVVYVSEKQMPDIMRLITKDLSEPYSIYTYRYFIHNWPKLCFLAMDKDVCIGAIVCKLGVHKRMVRRGYIAMLAVDSAYRRRKLGSTLVTKAIKAMIRDDCDEVVLETEITNQAALRLYENLGFVRDKRLFRYYLNGVDALRLKLWLR